MWVKNVGKKKKRLLRHNLFILESMMKVKSDVKGVQRFVPCLLASNETKQHMHMWRPKCTLRDYLTQVVNLGIKMGVIIIITTYIVQFDPM